MRQILHRFAHILQHPVHSCLVSLSDFCRQHQMYGFAG